MTDTEEPAAKISKLEIPGKEQEEEMDEGQEEWLSEGILTDDDYPADDQDKSDFNVNRSHGESTTPSLPDDDPEDGSLPGNPQIQDNSETLDNSQPEDNSNAQDNSSVQDNLDAQDNSDVQDNSDIQDNSHNQDNLLAQDSLTTEDNSEAKEYSHIDDIAQSQLDSHAQDNSNAQDAAIAQDKVHAQDKIDAQEQSASQVHSDAQVTLHAEDISSAQVEADAQDNSNAQDDSHAQASSVQEQVEQMSTEQTLDENIEQTLDNFENLQTSKLPDELGAFLVRKPDKTMADDKKDGSDMDASAKQSEDDGNDTDELLRMLGEDEQKNKKEIKMKKIEKVEQKRSHESQSSDDDEYIFEGAKTARLKMAKNAILKKYPTKAVPETVSEREDESDGSSDEGQTMKKMFVTRKTGNVAAKTASKQPKRDSVANVTKERVTVHRRPILKRPVTSTPLPKLQSKPEITIKKIKSTPVQKEAPKKVPEQQKAKELNKEAIKIIKEAPKLKMEPDEIIDEEGFLEEEDEFDLDEDFHSEPEKEGKQRIMRPEQMDEEVLTDCESQSDEDDESLYDFPSSGSDQDDWFTLDVRTERAGDYIPLLGSQARQLLSAEKKRVSSRLQSLRQNLSELNESGQQQAEMLRRATLQLAELDAALKA